MAIDKSKVLTISAQAYVGHRVVVRDSYEFVGVHAHCDFAEHVMDSFCRKVPDNAEVVVDYRESIASGRTRAGEVEGLSVILMSGTALIPRNIEKIRGA